MIILTCIISHFEGKEITLIGTAHISKESADLVSQVIEETKPDTVCVELCQSRYDSLTQKKKWENTDLLKVIKEKKAFLLLSNLLLASFQRKIGQKLGIRPGEEILQAIRSAEAAGAVVHSGRQGHTDHSVSNMAPHEFLEKGEAPDRGLVLRVGSG